MFWANSSFWGQGDGFAFKIILISYMINYEMLFSF